MILNKSSSVCTNFIILKREQIYIFFLFCRAKASTCCDTDGILVVHKKVKPQSSTNSGVGASRRRLVIHYAVMYLRDVTYTLYKNCVLSLAIFFVLMLNSLKLVHANKGRIFTITNTAINEKALNC